MKEAEFIRQTKDKQISDLKKMAEETNELRKNDYEKRVSGYTWLSGGNLLKP